VEVLDLCRDQPTVNRDGIHRLVGELALDFFGRALN